MWRDLLIIFIGGGVGSIMRYLLSKTLSSFTQYLPLGTLTANILASAIFGIVAGGLFSRFPQETLWRLLILTGFCGGLSTFSTFNFEIYEYLKSGNFILALLYIVGSLVFCLAAFAGATFIFSK